uniref:Uncharacterized protein n=1 Tax=viral metagenome TaxID=1070528 RepID=A0A6C0KXQ9_9ZZZZ
MPLLSYILNEEIENNIFLKELEKKNTTLKLTMNIYVPEEMQRLVFFYFSKFKYGSYSISKKILLIKEITDNIFICDDSKNKLIDLFCKLQRMYYGIIRFVYIWKYKKASIKVNEDFSFNPIDENKKNVFVLFQDNSKYLFNSNDLINIINSSLSNSPNFFSKPLLIKNPYNNTVLSTTSLFNIYFFLKFKTCNVPLLFELYFKSNFKLDDFAYNNECIIRNIKIENYVNCSDNKTLHCDIMDMLYEHSNIMNNMKIDIDFPKELLIKIMRPYLNLYINYMFQISGTEKKESSYIMLKKKLFKFAKFNPQFGKKILKSKKIFGKKVGPYEIIFDDKHINFYDNNDSEYFEEQMQHNQSYNIDSDSDSNTESNTIVDTDTGTEDNYNIDLDEDDEDEESVS